MTRPRIEGRDVSCSVEFAVIMNTMLTNPTGSMARSSERRPGAYAARTDAIPKMPVEAASRAGLGAFCLAITSAPASEPTPIADRITPYVPASPRSGPFASSGSRTEKLKQKVNTTAIHRSGRRSSGVLHTYSNPARS